MKVRQSETGNYRKDGKRYELVAEAPEDRPVPIWAQTNGYTTQRAYERVNANLDRYKAQRRSVITTRRYQEETKGVVAEGFEIQTDHQSQTKFAAIHARAIRDSSVVVNWKTPKGFVNLNAAKIKTVGDAIFDHVQAAFDRESELLALIDAAKDCEDLEKIVW